ncbi:SAM dependent carboxyl methyltransferase [Dillenia turbinata]|uniref:SAM dependent carboxyl methyltransferase n=1 Tax=Dillenia turbinata TaxID=194707 RepID=A0AAN8ZAJ9_9MAGN
MDVKEVLRMNRGVADNSYAQNTFTQKVNAITKPLLENTIRGLVLKNFRSYDLLNVADLGCATGPNTISVISTVVDTVKKTCQEINCSTPELQIYLNDLVGNDFNSLFNDLSRIPLHDEDMSCFVMGAPGSFHGRLFPRNSLHLVHSSYGVHWLSQVPRELISKQGLPLNRGKIYISKTSPPIVSKAYLSQFRKDFTLFLSCRSEEMVPESCAVLILHCRESANPWEFRGAWEHLAQAISDLVSEGLIEEEKLDTFNVPYYISSKEEIIDIVEREGSFTIELIETFTADDSKEQDEDIKSKGQKMAKNMRSFTEPMISHHFGNAIMDKLYDRVSCILIEFAAKESTHRTGIKVVLRRKAAISK